MTGLHAKPKELLQEGAKFGIVGGFGVLVNLAVFWVCREIFDLQPIVTSVASTVSATATNYLGNRYWAFKERSSGDDRRELFLFLVFASIGVGIEAGAVQVSHWIGFTSVFSETVAKFGFGLPIGTLFRFWAYRTFVFTGPHAEKDPETKPHYDAMAELAAESAVADAKA